VVSCLFFVNVPSREAERTCVTTYFKAQLADYVEYHRDPRNCAMHVLGIILLFLAAFLPLTEWSISLFGMQISWAAILVLPVLIYWLALDKSLGLAICGAVVLLLATAAVIDAYASAVTVWTTTAVLIAIGVASQIIGHRMFEQRQPALVDNPAHLLLGPMFLMTKLFIALGFRQDLAAIVGPALQQRPIDASLYPADRRSEPIGRS
jgi:uncharacterized membrane protein YGL010W